MEKLTCIMKCNMVDIQNDTRGFVKVIQFDGKEYLLIFTKAGYMRGGEIHEGRQFNFMLQGAAEWRIGGRVYDTYAPHYLVVPSNVPHMMCAKSDSLMLEFRERPLENPVLYYPPFRKLVEERRNEKDKK